MKQLAPVVLIAAACVASPGVRAPEQGGPLELVRPPAPRSVVVLPQPQRPTTLADSLALELAIYTTALNNGEATAHAAADPDVICVERWHPDPDLRPSTFEALRKDRTILIRPMSACIRDQPGPGQSGLSLFVDTLTGTRGISIWAGRPNFMFDGTFTFPTNYYQHGRSGAIWTCTGRRLDVEQWEISSCKMQLIL